MTIEQIVMWVVSACSFLVFVVMPILAKLIARQQIRKALQGMKDQTATIETLRQSIKQLEKQVADLKRCKRDK